MPAPARLGPVLLRLIVTRPADEAADWVAQLQAHGWPAQALPLIQITPPRQPAALAALHQQRARWGENDAILFVSGAAVRHFFDAPDVPAAGSGTAVRCWAPGPGTARALLAPLARLGLGAECIDAPPADAAQFDSEALWPVVKPQVRPGSRVLIVRGASVAGDDVTDQAGARGGVNSAGNGRDWLIQQCEQAGAQVQTLAVYERHAPTPTAEFHAQMQQGALPGSLWLFSSSEALDHLVAVDPGADWSAAQALATHPRIAQRARQAGFGHVLQTRPALADVLGVLESGWSRP